MEGLACVPVLTNTQETEEPEERDPGPRQSRAHPSPAGTGDLEDERGPKEPAQGRSRTWDLGTGGCDRCRHQARGAEGSEANSEGESSAHLSLAGLGTWRMKEAPGSRALARC